MRRDIYGQIDELRERLNSLCENGAPYDIILKASEMLDEKIVTFHKEN